MPRIIALQQGAVASVDLAHFAHRLDLGVTQAGAAPALALVYRFPPNPVALLAPQGLVSMAPFGQIALVRAVLEFAGEAAAVQRVADVALAGGTLDADIERTTEAFRLFRNMQGVRGATIDSALEEGLQVVRAYWFVREWIGTGMAEHTEGTFLGTRLLCRA